MGNLYKEGNVFSHNCAFCQKDKDTFRQYRNWMNVYFTKHLNKQMYFCCTKHFYKWLIMLKYICVPLQFKKIYMDNIHIIGELGNDFFNIYDMDTAMKYITGKLRTYPDSDIIDLDTDMLEQKNDILSYISRFINK